MKIPSITLSQLRDTRRLRAWLRAGKTVELRERNRVIAYIVPVKHGGKIKLRKLKN
jgi:antitoxin (DNA-binding transcriptional repressor) of toxin-antitoxin stability system